MLNLDDTTKVKILAQAISLNKKADVLSHPGACPGAQATRGVQALSYRALLRDSDILV